MSMYQELKNYINETDLKIIYTDKYLNIINYLKIIILEVDKIEVLIPKRILKIKGNNLKLTRIMNSELLITGKITEIKLVDYE